MLSPMASCAPAKRLMNITSSQHGGEVARGELGVIGGIARLVINRDIRLDVHPELVDGHVIIYRLACRRDRRLNSLVCHVCHAK